MSSSNVLQQKFMVNSYPNRGITFVRGEGAYLYSDTGKEYLDLFSNYGGSIFGHNNKLINHALLEQSQKLVLLHNSFSNDVRAKTSMKLVKKCGDMFEKVYWSNSGAEAVEAALKFAKKATGKNHFISCKGAYHGKTLGALSATSDIKYRKFYEPLLWDFTFVDYGDTLALISAITDSTAAFIVEPIQGESGIKVPSLGYLAEVAKICKDKGVLLILDEIQTGCGRTGSFLYSHQSATNADIVCIGKGLAGGLPVGATVVSSSIAEKLKDSVHTSTFGGNLLACAVTNAVLDTLNGDFYFSICSLGDQFMTGLRNINNQLIKEVRGVGLMIGFVVEEKYRNIILQKLQEKHILAIPAGNDVVRFLPPYIINQKQIEWALSTIERVLQNADS